MARTACQGGNSAATSFVEPTSRYSWRVHPPIGSDGMAPTALARAAVFIGLRANLRLKGKPHPAWPSARPGAVLTRWAWPDPILADGDESLALFGGVPHGNLDLSHNAGARGENVRIHLHSLEGEDVFALLDLLAELDFDGNDAPG